ncbi:MAG: hypothetical protein JO184_19005 [Gammaproteobacteria bacterium]|nr:hypothetical protein [Gammaproteobacteria bacterium]MBV8307944.1 hypothetical protein [Gammaproteobacteria bacterium]MBV8405555.1 hypothetical protein [Gammaproteobacteria bacterium]
MAAHINFGRREKPAHRHGPTNKLARFRPMNEVIPFMSRCPKCGDRQLQEGYTHRMLRRLLNTHANIEGYCGLCNEFWAISGLERDGIVIGLCD